MGINEFIADHGQWALLGCVLAMLLGGFVKGVVGFALPLIAVSTMGSFLPFDTAVALLILPTMASNVMQSLRNGPQDAWGSLKVFWRLNLVLVIVILLAAQLVVILPETVLFGFLGLSIIAFAVSSMAGWRAHFPVEARVNVELATGVIAGIFGGLSGVWGPPIVMYMLAMNVPKVEMVRALALSFMLGSFTLIAAHLHSGILNRSTLPVSGLLVIPAVLAMFMGRAVQDRLDQERFNRLTLFVLTLAGLNLIRRAMG